MERFEEEYKQKQKDEKLITMEDVVKVTDKLGGFEVYFYILFYK